LRFHDLRSIATTALIAEGVDVKTAQSRLGHSSPQVTLALYARATTEGDRRAAEKVGERFRPRDIRGMVRDGARYTEGR
jgi:integrase